MTRVAVLIFVFGMIAIAAACGTSDESEPSPWDFRTSPVPTIIPTPSGPPTPTPTPIPLRAGWTRYSADSMEIDLPQDWIGLAVTPDDIDALVKDVQARFPERVEQVSALRNARTLKVWGADPSKERGSDVVFQAGNDVRIIWELDQYLDSIANERALQGFAVFLGKKFELRENEAVNVLQFHTTTNNGVETGSEQRMVVTDVGAFRYIMSLTFPADQSDTYVPLWELIVETFRPTPKPLRSIRP